MKMFLKIITAGWVLALTFALTHVYFDLITLKYWYLQVIVLIVLASLFTTWVWMVAKILKTNNDKTRQKTEVLNIPNVSNSFICVNKMHYTKITEGKKYVPGKSNYSTKRGLTLVVNDNHENAAYPNRCFEQINDC